MTNPASNNPGVKLCSNLSVSGRGSAAGKSVNRACSIYNINTVFDLISEHTLISGHPPYFVLVKTIARARRDLCALAVLLCCIMQSIFDAN